jgi:hypothetical protein
MAAETGQGILPLYPGMPDEVEWFAGIEKTLHNREV